MRLVNLFSGGGGFACGAERVGSSVILAVDKDAVLTSSHAKNFPKSKLVLADVRSMAGETVRSAAKMEIDGIIGGPPCQGFSGIGKRNPADPRRELVWHFCRIVEEVQPKFFVMENVPGLAYAGSREVLDTALGMVRGRYSVLGPLILEARQFGGATTRPRLFVIGIHKDHGESLSEADICRFSKPTTTVREAIADLEGAVAIGEIGGFDVWRIRKNEKASGYAQDRWTESRTFTGHRKATHSLEVATRFGVVPQGGIDRVGRHPRLAWAEQCPTIRAGTGSYRGSYLAVRPIHPESPRVITVREAARLQGFPDAHVFHPTVWHSFRMIGNSVCPIVAEAIFGAIKEKLQRVTAPAGIGE